MRILNARAHGYFDYAYSLLFLLAPSLFEFSASPTALSYTIGSLYFFMTLLTDYPLGSVRAFPFQTHGNLELGTSVICFTLPWIAHFTEEMAARNFFTVSAMVMFAIWFFTEYSESHAEHSNSDTIDDTSFRRVS